LKRTQVTFVMWYTDGDVVCQDYLSCLPVSLPVRVKKKLFSQWTDVVIIYSERVY